MSKIENKILAKIQIEKQDEVYNLLNKLNIVEDLQIKCLNKFQNYIPELKIEIKKSNIHGYGVFATKNIKKNEIITFYPADIIIKKDKIGSKIYTSERYSEKKEENKTLTNWKNDGSPLNNPYLLNINKEYSIIGDSDFKDNLNYVGHLINDGAKHNRTEKSKQIYMKIAFLKMNCCYEKSNTCVYIEAIKDIKKNEELFMAYGIDYWNVY
tara:strand:+ start:166 stop:798 length:633 start_codon:yes stop_codon:yes gene_type:complete